MEVHQHAHTHGKKTWKSYIWEFLMLFFAVFCGFFAEYQLEHKIEKDREKVYIKSMIEDLVTDTINLNISLSSFNRQDKHFDTIFALFYTINKSSYNPVLMNGLDSIVGYKEFFATDRTLEQLKSSGGMRLIRNKKAADGITIYDSKLKEYQKSLSVLDEVFSKMYDLSLEIIDKQNLEKAKQTLSTEQLITGNKNYLLKTDNAILGNYFNRLKSYRLLRTILVRRMKILKSNSKELLELLKIEYKLT